MFYILFFTPSLGNLMFYFTQKHFPPTALALPVLQGHTGQALIGLDVDSLGCFEIEHAAPGFFSVHCAYRLIGYLVTMRSYK